MLAQRSKELLGRYRRGEAVGEECPLRRRWRATTSRQPSQPPWFCIFLIDFLAMHRNFQGGVDAKYHVVALGYAAP